MFFYIVLTPISTTLFCSIHLLYEDLISILSKQSSGTYATFEKCAVIIIDIEKIQKIKVKREDASFVEFNLSLTIRLRDFFDHQELGR